MFYELVVYMYMLDNLGDEEELKEKILSIPHHCSNSHHFPNNKHHRSCSHGDLSCEERQKPWLVEGSKVRTKMAKISFSILVLLN